MYNLEHLKGLMEGKTLELPTPKYSWEERDLNDLITMLRSKGFTVRKVAISANEDCVYTHFRISAQKDAAK